MTTRLTVKRFRIRRPDPVEPLQPITLPLPVTLPVA